MKTSQKEVNKYPSFEWESNPSSKKLNDSKPCALGCAAFEIDDLTLKLYAFAMQ
jgi:hypothetical protein